MSLFVTGLSHHTSDVELRERLAFAEEAIPGALLQFRKCIEDAGVVIISTCNRSEVYVSHVSADADLHREIRSFLSEWHSIPEDEFRDALYEYRDREAVGHLFRVASSLDSLVVGEGQILGQVHDAYSIAHAEQTTDKVLNALFQRAFSVAKKVRAQSRIGVGKVSISSVAVDLAVSIFMDLSGKTVMVIGSGEMGELTLKSLVSQGVGAVLVANRTLSKAEDLAAQYNGKGIALADLEFHLHRADIVISSTAAPGVVLRAADFQQALKKRGQQPMFVIDIAVPRDVDTAVNEIDNVYLYDVDNLQEVADKNLEARRTEVDKCLEIVEAGVDQFLKWFGGLTAEPTIVSLSSAFNEIRERELEKTLSSLNDLNDKQREEVAYLSKRIVNNILQQPLTQLKREVIDEDPGNLLRLVRRLFGLKEST